MSKKDHRELGQMLELFHIDPEIGRGLPLWLPRGAVLREELEKLAKELEFRAGYERVFSPHIAQRELYRSSGHLAYFESHMFPVMERKGDESEAYCLRPMNCPHHHRIFAMRPRSYRELPMRLAEYGQVYRYEDSGALSGLMRVRGLCQNDAHIYCAREQVRSELKAVLDLHLRAWEILGIRDWSLRLSLWDPAAREKFVAKPAEWEWAQSLLRSALGEMNLPYVDGPGEAAFYGPKIDVQLRGANGKEETVSTIQLDFAQAERLGLRYVGADGAEHVPYVIHRAPFGSHERFIAFLIELYQGAFPLWLAPVQVRVCSVGEEQAPAASGLVARLRERGIRAEGDVEDASLADKVRRAAGVKLPYVAVVGRREAGSGKVSVRERGKSAAAEMNEEDFVARLELEIRKRQLISKEE